MSGLTRKTCFLAVTVLAIACLAILVPVSASAPAIQIYSDPSGANLVVDGYWYDTTPSTDYDVSNGWHTVYITMDGYQPYSESVYVQDGTTVVNAILVRNTPEVGSLDIGSQPSDADIWLDGYYRGSTPQVIGNLWIGNHKLIVKKAGYYDYTDTVNIGSAAVYGYTAVLSPYSPQPEYGSLQIDTNPGGAAVFVNGNYKGNTPAAYDPLYVTQLTPGTYTVKLVLPDYQVYTQDAVVQAGIVNDLHITLNPVTPGPTPDTTGQILVYSTPSGANLYLDNAYKGLTPLTLSDIPAGSHTVTLRMNGYQDFTKQVTVTAGSVADGSGTLSPSASPVKTTGPAPQPTKSPVSAITVALAIGICGAIFFVRKNR